MLTSLIELASDDCVDLLTASRFGRLGVVVDGRPEIFPVNYVYARERGCVEFPTYSGTKLYAAVNSPWVALEVDSVDPDGQSGWSVLVVGKAHVITDAADLARLASERHVQWGTGRSLTWVAIVPSKVTGRRVSASAGRADAMPEP
jgi:uncharacterized protein